MADLPADLPTNWTQGQIISPNGTEVGLTAQHGYNYLMEQVNAAQTAINTAQGAIDSINQALESVAQESTLQGVATDVEGISGLIGTTTDTGGSTTAGSVMGKLNNLINHNALQLSNAQEMYLRSNVIEVSESYDKIQDGMSLANIEGEGVFWGVGGAVNGAGIKVIIDGNEILNFYSYTATDTGISFGEIGPSGADAQWASFTGGVQVSGTMYIHDLIPVFRESLQVIITAKGTVTVSTKSIMARYSLFSD